MLRGIVIVGERPLERGRPGDPEGGGGPWRVPREGLMMPSLEAEYVSTRRWVTAWDPRATADLNRDGVCDIVWTRDDTRQLAVTLTNRTENPPRFVEPTFADVFDSLKEDQVVVGSGDFVGAGSSRGEEAEVPPPDGSADLVLWHGASRTLSVWASTGDGGFSVEQRHDVTVDESGWQPAVIANIDGVDTPEIIWIDDGSIAPRLVYSRIGRKPEGLTHSAGGSLFPDMLETGWVIRAADDFDDDGRDDLVLQNETSEQSSVWYMDGVTRRSVDAFSPSRLKPSDLDSRLVVFTILGPR
jgi:ketosteroid isomerase-like protein